MPDNGASVNASLTPKLTDLDRRILAAVKHPRRARDIAKTITRQPYGHPSWWSNEAKLRYGREVEAKTAEVLRILRGLEHLGYVKCTHNGWWRAR